MAKIAHIDLGEFPLLLAPMEDVSDPPFRKLCKEQGADMMYTEFISSEGLIRDAAKSLIKLDVFEYERPIGIQLFGSEISSMREAAEIAEKANPDLIDINYGCPVKNVACKGAGSALLQDIPKMVAMTKEIVDAVGLPVTVKTRLGWDDNTKNIVEVAERLQDIGVQALSIHGRTRSQRGSFDDHREVIPKKSGGPDESVGEPNWPQIVAGLLDEPFCLSMSEVSNLTMRQISLLYYRERDNKGIPRPIKQMYDYDEDGKLIDRSKDEFFNLGMALGLTPEELERRWEEAQSGK